MAGDGTKKIQEKKKEAVPKTLFITNETSLSHYITLVLGDIETDDAKKNSGVVPEPTEGRDRKKKTENAG